MRLSVLVIAILFASVCSYANQVWLCSTNNHGITLTTCISEKADSIPTLKIQAAFLNLLAKDLRLKESPLKISVTYNLHNWWFKENDGREFATIAYDTIRNEEDNSFIAVGLRIILTNYNLDSINLYNRIFSLVKYGIENIESIRKTQSIVPAITYTAQQVPLLSIDTALIKSIPTEQLNFNPEKALKRKNIAFPISIFAALIGAFVAIFAGTAAKRKNAKA